MKADLASSVIPFFMFENKHESINLSIQAKRIQLSFIKLSNASAFYSEAVSIKKVSVSIGTPNIMIIRYIT